ncbi:MAG TPA: NosD domain-containing protein [Thermotogota bacterium]|nr:NosD domain-containing protein [Thermotogota bacterium]
MGGKGFLSSVKVVGVSILFFGGLMLFFSSCAPSKGQIRPPDTRFLEVAERYGADRVSFLVEGEDERTPREKLRFSIRVYIAPEENKPHPVPSTKDLLSGLLTYEGSSTTGSISFPSEEIGEGEFLVHVSAINEFGLADESPAEALFTVDFSPPASPRVQARLVAGKILLSARLLEYPPDFHHFEVQVFPGEKQVFSESSGLFEIPARLGEEYLLQTVAVDDVGNRSRSESMEFSTLRDDPPQLEKPIPSLLGGNLDRVEVWYFDDWDPVEKVETQATMSNLPVRIRDSAIKLDLHALPEGTQTLWIGLKDSKGHLNLLRKDIFVDLTPPHTPNQPSIEARSEKFELTWEKDVDQDSYGVYGSNDGSNWDLLGTVDEPFFSTDERYLQYGVSAFDLAGNESGVSYPVRTYDQTYTPAISPEIVSLQENTLLTTTYSPFVIQQPLEVAKGVTLAMERGVEIQFQNQGSLSVAGQMLVIPSPSEKESLIRSEDRADPSQALITLDGGELWLEGVRLQGNDGVFLAVNRNGNAMIQQGSSLGFSVFATVSEADGLTLSEMDIQATTLVFGDSLQTLKILDSTLQSVEGVNLDNVQDLSMNNVNILASRSAIRVGSLSNITLDLCEIQAPNALRLEKFSAGTAARCDFVASETAISIMGASTLNLRKSTITGAICGICVDQSSYLSILESEIVECATGISILNSDVRAISTSLSKNGVGILQKGRFSFESEDVIFPNTPKPIVQDTP